MRNFRGFAYALLTLVALGAFASGISSQSNSPKPDDCDECCQYQIRVLENTPSKDIHLVYDFSRGTVSTVVVRKDLSAPEIRVYTSKLGQ